MPPVMSALLAFVVALFRSRAALCLENLALRQQVAIYKQAVPRPRLHPTDRLFWVWLSRLWSEWQNVLAFVQPCTVIAWPRSVPSSHNAARQCGRLSPAPGLSSMAHARTATLGRILIMICWS